MGKVVEVELNPVTKKLVVRLEDGFGREGIESLRAMDKEAALAIDTGLEQMAQREPLFKLFDCHGREQSPRGHSDDAIHDLGIRLRLALLRALGRHT